MSQRSILIVEDEASIALALSLQLEDLGYAVMATLPTALEAVEQVDRERPDLILMDVRLRGALDGIDAARRIRQKHDVPVIFLTSHSDDATVERAARTSPYGYLTKPYQIRELRAGIEVALTKARLERELRLSDRWFTQTLHCVHDGVVLTERDATIRFMNPAAEAMTGWTRQEATGLPLQQVLALRRHAATDIGPAAASLAGSVDASALVRHVIDQGRPLNVAYGSTLVSRDGREHAVDESAGPVLEADGAQMGAVFVIRDAGPRLEQESLLRGSEERFRHAFENAPCGMAIVSTTGRFLQVNHALCRLLDTSPESVLGSPQADYIWDEDRARQEEEMHRLLSGGAGSSRFEMRYRRPRDGQGVWVLVSATLLVDRNDVACCLYQIDDLTGQRLVAEQMAALAEERLRREALELANQSKAEFMSRASHEMRTPLNAVIGFASLLQLPAASAPRASEYARHIESAGRHLLTLVDDILDLQRSAQQSLAMHIEPIEVAAIVHEAGALLTPLAQAQRVTIRIDAPAGLRVAADGTRLRQVLLNVCSNAVKYNRVGGDVAIHASGPFDGFVRIVVTDSGIGMTLAQQARLFQPFDRLGREQTRIPGTGLGLVIARTLVNDMAGTLAVTSRERSGTTISIELPQAVEVLAPAALSRG